MTTGTTAVGATTTSRSEHGSGVAALITGFPALRARSVLNAVLAEESELGVVALVHEERFEEAEALLAELEPSLASRVELRVADPAAMDFGLSGPAYLELVDRVRVVHAAYSVVDPSVAGDVCEAVNVGAAREIIELGRASKRRPRVIWYSSVFVSGTRRGPVFEGDLDAGQSFRNRAERTLAIAERMLRQSELPLTVLRAGHLVGAAPHGEVEALTAGPYPLVALLVSTPEDTPLPLPPGSEAPLPLTPVDYLGALGAFVAHRDLGSHRQTFHVFDPERLTLGRFLELVAERSGRKIERGFNPSTLTRLLFGAGGPKFSIPGGGAPKTGSFNSFAKLLPQSARGILDVLTTAAEYDQMHVQELLTAGAPSCPPLESTLGALLEHVRSRVQDGNLVRARPARAPWLVA